MRLCRALALLAAAGAHGPGHGAEAGGDGLDLSRVVALAEAGAGSEAPPAALRAYGRLVRVLRREGNPGLGPDLGKLRAAAAACAGPLSADGVLRDSVGDALGEGGARLRALDAEVLGAAGSLVIEQDRDRVLGAAARARRLERDGELEVSLGNDVAGAALLRRAAAGLLRALRKAEALLARETPRKPAFAVPLKGRGGALLSVCGDPGTAPRLVAVGADDGAGPQFLVLHPGAEAWVRIPVAAEGDLWWAERVPGDGFWASGSGGRVVRYDPATGVLEDRSTGADAVLYGVWGAGPGDVWAVGGDPAGVGPRPALLHWDGSGWSPAALPPEAADLVLYKVWGTAADDAWAVGEGGLLLHFDGSAWSSVPSGTLSPLLTVHGPSPVSAVGGGAAAAAVEQGEGGVFAAVAVTGANSGTGSQTGPGPVRTLNGVFVPASGPALAVGMAGTLVRRESSGFVGVAGVPSGVKDFHAVWVDDEGNALLAGGDLSSLGAGGLVSWGKRRIPSEVVPQGRFRGGVADLLYLRCAHSGCHLPPFSNAGLSMDSPEVTHPNLVLAPSTQSPLLRVFPGRSSQSYLWHKLAGTQETVGGSGDRMPVFHLAGDDFLDAGEMDLIRGWILDGARDD